MRELGLWLPLNESPPISALIVGVNPSPDGDAELVYVDGYFPGYGQINERGQSTGSETVIYQKRDPLTGAWQIVDFKEPHHMDAFRSMLEAPTPVDPSYRPHRSLIPQRVRVAQSV